MRNRSWKAALILAAVISVPQAVQAREDNGSHKVLKVALWGDEFYDDSAALVDQTIESMNNHKLDFTLFAGDTKNGSSPCTDAAIGDEVIAIFNRLKAPTVYTLGDNEWTDCHRTSNGSYDPLERLAYLRTTFFSTNKSQGTNPIKLKRQGALGQEYSENSRFEKNEVEFVSLHIPGSNNNLITAADLLLPKGLCHNKSTRTDAQCIATTAEYPARNAMNVAWLQESFAEARDKHYAGIVIVIQADIFFPFELSDGGYDAAFLPSLTAANGYSDFWKELVAETQTFSGQVVLVHGDSHYFKIDKAMVNDDGRLTPNFTRVEVFGNADNSWVEMTVDPDAENVFSFIPVVLN
jgi:hypothetical protein